MAARNGILALSIDRAQVLHSAYMPFISNGGLFISTGASYQIGSEVFLIIKLPDSPEQIAVLGKVIWKSPTRARGIARGGFGVQFQDRGSAVKTKIESLLGGQFPQDLKTQTL